MNLKSTVLVSPHQPARFWFYLAISDTSLGPHSEMSTDGPATYDYLCVWQHDMWMSHWWSWLVLIQMHCQPACSSLLALQGQLQLSHWLEFEPHLKREAQQHLLVKYSEYDSTQWMPLNFSLISRLANSPGIPFISLDIKSSACNRDPSLYYMLLLKYTYIYF